MSHAGKRFRDDRESPSHRTSRAVLLLIDVINPMDFDGAEEMLAPAEEAARRIRVLKERCREHGIPAIYVNDNYDCWHLGFAELVERLPRCRRSRASDYRRRSRPSPAEDSTC